MPSDESAGQNAGVGQSGPAEGPDPWCTWCHVEPPDGELPFRIRGEDDGRWPAAFCSLECAARWGCAAHQDRIYHVEHGRGIRTDGGREQDDAGVCRECGRYVPERGHKTDCPRWYDAV